MQLKITALLRGLEGKCLEHNRSYKLCAECIAEAIMAEIY
jgi:hypothetical protein